jgi:myo-inositol-1(or 4)-monophosphatase
MQGSANLNIMMKAARKAGRSLVKDFREVENLQVSSKGAGDFVSRADIAAEKILKDELMGARPNYGWMAEESAAEDGQGPDPALDRRSARRDDELPARPAALGGVHRARVQGRDRVGRGLRPAKDEMFYAEKGAGAWLNDSQRLRVSGRAMIESIFATGVPFGGRRACPTR